MTGVVGILLAVVAGWTVLDRRRAAMVVIAPFMAVLALQTWYIAGGHAVSPPSTVTAFPGLIGYYIVQVIILGLALGAGDQIRLRRAAASAEGPSTRSSRRTGTALTLNTAISALVVFFLSNEHSFAERGVVVHHSSQGSPPALAMAAIGLSAVIFAVGGLLRLTDHRTRRTAVESPTELARRQRPA